MVVNLCYFCSNWRNKIKITDTKLYVLNVTLSTQDNAKLLQQLSFGFKIIINWNKYQSNPNTCAQNRYLNPLVDPIFQGENRLFVLSFENEDDRTSPSTYYLPKVEIKDSNVMIDVKNFFIQSANSDLKAYKTTGCLLDYSYFKENYKMILIDLSKQQVLRPDSRAIQQINFTANLDRAGNTTMLFIIEEAKETVLGFSQGTVKLL